MRLTPQELQNMVNELDKDGSGEIEFEEFIAVLSKDLTLNYGAAEITNAFKTFARNAPPGWLRRLHDLTDLYLYVYIWVIFFCVCSCALFVCVWFRIVPDSQHVTLESIDSMKLTDFLFDWLAWRFARWACLSLNVFPNGKLKQLPQTSRHLHVVAAAPLENIKIVQLP